MFATTSHLLKYKTQLSRKWKEVEESASVTPTNNVKGIYPVNIDNSNRIFVTCRRWY